jgi:hypothetical protein
MCGKRRKEGGKRPMKLRYSTPVDIRKVSKTLQCIMRVSVAKDYSLKVRASAQISVFFLSHQHASLFSVSTASNITTFYWMQTQKHTSCMERAHLRSSSAQDWASWSIEGHKVPVKTCQLVLVKHLSQQCV